MKMTKRSWAKLVIVMIYGIVTVVAMVLGTIFPIAITSIPHIASFAGMCAKWAWSLIYKWS